TIYAQCASGQLYAGPTHVGMDRRAHPMHIQPPSRPHARGDGPMTRTDTRRPHARGDGPQRETVQGREPPEAPRTWGWTGQKPNEAPSGAAGPTHVGMDRTRRRGMGGQARRPHARGDGPTAALWIWDNGLQAPRTWGWTEPDLLGVERGPA